MGSGALHHHPAITSRPGGFCFLSYPHALADGLPVPDSSGLAFGVRLEDAIERAALEIIERDAVSIWWYGQVRRPEIEIDLKNFSLWKDFAAWMHKSDRSFWMLDLTHDLGMPVAAAVSCNAGGTILPSALQPPAAVKLPHCRPWANSFSSKRRSGC